MSTNEMIEILEKKNKYQYAFEINDMQNIGSPHLALKAVTNYIFGNSDDLIIVHHMVFNGNAYYAELSRDENIEKFCELINSQKNSIKGYNISSDSEELFLNRIFIKNFGTLKYKKHEMFGIKNISDIPKIDLGITEIRELDESDEDTAMSFEEEKAEFRSNLQMGFKHYVKQKDDVGIIYGAFENGVLCGYLSVATFDDKIWDIDYIYVHEKHRGKGIAKKLANYYALAITAQGMIANYGGADNEMSKSVALSSGFDLYCVRYFCSWIYG